jgi:hypothetical protein
MAEPLPFRGPQTSDRRESDREAVLIEADLRRPGRTPFRTRIRDMSPTGCRCETLSRTQAGDRIWLTLPGFAAMEAVIRWSTPTSFGCEWRLPIHPSVFEHIRKSYPDITR